MTGRRRVAVAVAAGLVLTVAACADDGNDGASSSGPSTPLVDDSLGETTVPVVATTEPPTTVERTGRVVSVTALDNTFRPDRIEIDVGDEVRWENRGVNDHDVLYVDGDGWGVEVEGFGPGAAYVHVFSAPGEYRYYCSIHGNETVGMVGTVVVRG